MINTSYARRGIAVAPHSLAAQSALAVLRDGGDAIEAMVAAAATIAVVYPHMNGIGGDAFWVIGAPGEPALALDACGPAARAATIGYYRERGQAQIPARGPMAANTVAGTVAGWDLALAISRSRWGARLPLARLLEDAIHYAEAGVCVTVSQETNTRAKLAELAPLPGFGARFLAAGQVPARGTLIVQKTLGATLRRLATAGLDDFYRGELARSLAADLAALGSPLALLDLESYHARQVRPLELAHGLGRLYNMTAPSQGAVSLAILGILERIGFARLEPESADCVHAIVEATKAAFLGIRDPYLADPARMALEPQALLDSARLDDLALQVDMTRARPWGGSSGPGGTVWMGVVDGKGRAVSFIQSIYHEFGSGVVLPQSHINWQNRGCSFSLDATRLNALAPGRKPFHTLNPALARLADGRSMIYGTMGGDGQPQTQAALFTRYAVFGQPLQRALSAPRWLLGRTWGSSSETLKLEARFPLPVVSELRRRGHDVELLAEFDETVGHAGALVRYPDGALEGAADPRGDGCVAGF